MLLGTNTSKNEKETTPKIKKEKYKRKATK